MIYQQLFEGYNRDKPVLCGLIGAGKYGSEIVAQSMKAKTVRMDVVVDRDLAAAKKALLVSGVPEEYIVVCDSRADALRAIEAGKRAVAADASVIFDLPLDVIVEATGVPEAGAYNAYQAIQNGKHVAMVNKETDSAVGPMLKRLADEAGVVYTAVDGDQHGLFMGLYYWAESLGFEILCGGKFRDFELTYDSATGSAADGSGRVRATVSENDAWAMRQMRGDDTARQLAKRAEILGVANSVGGYDICEMTIMANATGLKPATPAMHNPPLRITEIPSVLCLKDDGGILGEAGVLDVVTCVKDAGGPTAGGGVFAVVSCGGDFAGKSLAKKLDANSNGTAAVIYRPMHLTGLETLTSILCAGLVGIPTGSRKLVQRFDMVRKTTRPMKAGEILGGDHAPEFTSLMVPAAAVAGESPLPAHLATDNRLAIDVPAGTIITGDMVQEPKNSTLWSLRRRQDELRF